MYIESRDSQKKGKSTEFFGVESEKMLGTELTADAFTYREVEPDLKEDYHV